MAWRGVHRDHYTTFLCTNNNTGTVEPQRTERSLVECYWAGRSNALQWSDDLPPQLFEAIQSHHVRRRWWRRPQRKICEIPAEGNNMSTGDGRAGNPLLWRTCLRIRPHVRVEGFLVRLVWSFRGWMGKTVIPLACHACAKKWGLVRAVICS